MAGPAALLLLALLGLLVPAVPAGALEPVPSGAADFFPPTSPRMDVVVPEDAGDDVLRAGLRTVAALAARYPDASVGLRGADDQVPAAGPGQRVVSLTEDDGPLRSTVRVGDDGVPVLALAGSGQQLSALAQSFAPAVAGVPAPRRRLADLAGLGESPLRLGGPGAASREVDVPQDAFGGPVAALRVRLVGTATVPAGSRPRLEVLADDEAVASTRLRPGPVRLDAEVPAAALDSVVDLRLRLVATSRTGGPGGASVVLDPVTSVLDAEPGATSGGLADFPQVLGGGLAVGLRTGDGPGEPVAAARRAAPVVAALQRAAARPLAVDLVDPEVLLDAGASGLLVDADAADLRALGAPEPSPTAPTATLQVVDDQRRELLVLSATGSPASARDLQLDRAAYQVVTAGWDALRGSTLTLARGREAVPVPGSAPGSARGSDRGGPAPTGSPTPADPAPDVAPTGARDPGADQAVRVQAFVAGVGVLLLVLALWTLGAWRRARRRSPEPAVDAGEAAARATHRPGPPRTATRGVRPSAGGTDRSRRPSSRRPGRASGRSGRRTVAGVRPDRRP